MTRKKALKILIDYGRANGQQPDRNDFQYICEESGTTYTLDKLWEIVQAERGEFIHLRYTPTRNRRKKFN